MPQRLAALLPCRVALRILVAQKNSTSVCLARTSHVAFTANWSCLSITLVCAVSCLAKRSMNPSSDRSSTVLLARSSQRLFGAFSDRSNLSNAFNFSAQSKTLPSVYYVMLQKKRNMDARHLPKSLSEHCHFARRSRSFACKTRPLHTELHQWRPTALSECMMVVIPVSIDLWPLLARRPQLIELVVLRLQLSLNRFSNFCIVSAIDDSYYYTFYRFFVVLNVQFPTLSVLCSI